MPKTDIKIIDYNDHPGFLTEYWFVADVGELKEQEFTPYLWEILESELKAGNIKDYLNRGAGTVIIDLGEEIVTWPNSTRVSKQRKIILNYQEWISDHMNEDVLKRFINYSFKRDLI